MSPGCKAFAARIRDRAMPPTSRSPCAGSAATRRHAHCCCSTEFRKAIRSAAGLVFPPDATDRIGSIRVTRGGGSGYQGAGALAGTVEVDSATPGDRSTVLGAMSYGSRDSVDARASHVVQVGSSAF